MVRIEHRGSSRPFAVTFGLSAGYGANARTFSEAEASEVIHAWMAARIKAGKPYITGTISPGTVLYGWGNAGEEPNLGKEAQVRFMGVLHPHFQAEVSDEDALDQLVELAQVVGNKLEQTRVWVEFVGEVLVLLLKE